MKPPVTVRTEELSSQPEHCASCYASVPDIKEESQLLRYDGYGYCLDCFHNGGVWRYVGNKESIFHASGVPFSPSRCTGSEQEMLLSMGMKPKPR